MKTRRLEKKDSRDNYGLAFEKILQAQIDLKATWPYGPPTPPPTGRQLTNRQKIALATTILSIIAIFAVVVLLAEHRL